MGQRLRQDNGEDLLAYLQEVDHNDLGAIAERFTQLDKIMSDDVMRHQPDLASLIQVAEGAAHIIDHDVEDGGEQQYWNLMKGSSAFNTCPRWSHRRVS